MKKKRLFIIVPILLMVVMLTVSFAITEREYTRERAEELFHLINWHEYTLETFQQALREQKPVYLVLSAPAWCYWCHVYESEDYLYHPELYPFINNNFIAIFIDSDKRPDLTKKYMEGGWPSTTILTPDMRRIEGFSGPTDPLALKEYLAKVVDFLRDKSFNELENEFTYREVETRIPEETHLSELEEILLNHLDKTFDETYGGIIQGAGNMKRRAAPTISTWFKSPLIISIRTLQKLIKSTAFMILLKEDFTGTAQKRTGPSLIMKSCSAIRQSC
jgi:uncharacterized protein YyaL (SSP411 family)